jgi:predicted nuclease of predicted toxin-antitoxin system
VTLDKDFGELAIVHGMPHCGILRLVNFSAKLQAAVCIHALNLYGKDLESGAIVTAEPGRLRIRPPDM